MPALTDRHWTADDLAALPEDGNRYEIIDGELFVSPAPAILHQLVLSSLHFLITGYLEEHPELGRAIAAPSDVKFSERTVVQPDLYVALLVNGRVPSSWREAGRIPLAAEIVSPSSGRHDRTRKRRLYQREGVEEYWAVDPGLMLVERWRPGDERPEVVEERIEWRPDPPIPGVTIELTRLFRDVALAP